jgi:hypothetical protein
MKSVRTAVAAAALAIAVVPVTLAGCGSQPATPAATPSSTSAATAPVNPATTPAPTQTPGPVATSPAPSIRVISSRLAYPWHWPNEPARPGRVVHSYPVPPMPELVQISVGYHPGEHGQLPYSRMSFTFTQAFPSYHFEWVTQLVSDASGYTRAVLLSNPQTAVRAYEVEVVTAAGQHRYIVAIDINAVQHD